MRWTSLSSQAQRSAIRTLAEAAARRQPDAPGLQLTLAEAIFASGDHEQALAQLERACVRLPQDEPLHAGYARALLEMGRCEAALAHVAPWSGTLWARRLAFKALWRLKAFDRLRELEVDLARDDPANPDLLEFCAVSRQGSPDAVHEACDRALAHDPGAIHAVYHKTVALAQLGRREEAAELMALERFVRLERLEVGDAGMPAEAFHAELQREIAANPTLHADPIGHATEQGIRTAVYPHPADRAAPALIRAIKRRVADYAASLAGDHAFVAARPASARFKAWALMFENLGRQRLHHHPGAWLTGVFYVAAPAVDGPAGTLRIGGIPGWAGVPPPWQPIHVAPSPGTLVLFPSFVPHETIPSLSAESRVSIAFDVTDSRRPIGSAS